MLPLEIYESIWYNPGFLDRYRDEISLLLGSEIRSFADFKIVGSRINRLSNVKGVKYSHGEYKDVVHYYKDLEADMYLEYPILSAMRGSVTREYSNGEVRQVAFPFAKFFNYREVPHTQKLPDSTSFMATEKLDGTLIVVWIDPDTGEIRYNTRGLLDHHGVTWGRTGVYVHSTPDRISNPYVIRFINSVKRLGLWYELESLVKEDRTVMFELVYKIPASQQFNVLETPEDSEDWKPYLLAYRDHRTLDLAYPDNTSFPAPKRYDIGDFRELMKFVVEQTDREGVVIYYPGMYYHPELKWWNYLVKLKNRVYVLKSYILSGEATWKHLALIVLNGKEDDLIPILDGEKASFMREYRKKYTVLLEVWRGFIDKVLEHKAKKGDKVYNILKHNLHAGYLVGYIKKIEHVKGKEVLIEETAKSIVKRYLIYKNSREAMLKALDRFTARLWKLAEELDGVYGNE